MKSEILTIQQNIKSGKISKEQILKNAKESAMKNQEKCNSFVTLIDADLNLLEGPLSGIPYTLKDNFSTKGILTTASSNTLKNYVPVYNATIYEKLIAAGATLIGKNTMDEFGLGATGTTAHTGLVHNPWNTSKQTSGSSAGSAACVAAGVVPFSIGSDTGDSIRKPAAYCGIVGYKPTYGMISRYGLFPFASSLDHVGILTRTVLDAAIVAENIKGQDPKDMTSWDSSSINLIEELEKKDTKTKKLFYIKELIDINNYTNPSDSLKETLKIFKNTIQKCKELNMEVDEISFDKALLKVIHSTYTCISSAEATSNLSNLTGILFGPRKQSDDITSMIIKHRTEGFSPLIKRRLIIGSYVLQKENQEKYFINAQRVRNLIVQKMNELFQQYDALILPCSEKGAKDFDENSLDCEMLDVLENHMAIGNFGGFPSITIPNGFVNKLPIGINLTSKVKDDANLLKIAQKLEEALGFAGQIAGGNDK